MKTPVNPRTAGTSPKTLQSASVNQPNLPNALLSEAVQGDELAHARAVRSTPGINVNDVNLDEAFPQELSDGE